MLFRRGLYGGCALFPLAERYRPVISRYLFAEERADAEESWVSGDRCQSSMSDEAQPRR
jgi:hypothetical protein